MEMDRTSPILSFTQRILRHDRSHKSGSHQVALATANIERKSNEAKYDDLFGGEGELKNAFSSFSNFNEASRM